MAKSKTQLEPKVETLDDNRFSGKNYDELIAAIDQIDSKFALDCWMIQRWTAPEGWPSNIEISVGDDDMIQRISYPPDTYFPFISDEWELIFSALKRKGLKLSVIDGMDSNDNHYVIFDVNYEGLKSILSNEEYTDEFKLEMATKLFTNNIFDN